MTVMIKNIPNLIGGISRQPPETRLTNQCEDQMNFICSPALGLTVRPSLKFRSSSSYSDDGAFFILDRDENTQHNIWISESGIRVEDLEGNVKDVQNIDNALAYLALPDGKTPRDNYRILPVADYCYIVNRTKTVQIDPDSFTPRKNQALVHIKQVNHGTTWSLIVDGVQASFGYSTDTSKSISTEEVASNLTSQLLSISTIAADFNIITASSVIYITRKDGGKFSVGLADTRGNTYSSLTTYKIKDFTDLPTIAPNGFTCCVSGNNGSTADDYYVRFRATEEQAPYRWIDTGVDLDSNEIRCSCSPTQINDSSPIKVSTKVSCTNVPNFITTVINIRYGHMLSIPFTTITFADRFPSNPGKLTYAVGAANTETNLARGVWEECAAPDQPVKFNNATMPHVLIHDMINDTWTFRAVNWTERKVGDDESAPFPSFVNKPITNAFVYRNRIGFIAGDSVSMSAAGDLENFFPETVQTMTDADPIDMHIAVDDYSDILATTTVQDNLIFWSKKRQYTLTTPEALSPKTAAILPSTAYTCLPDAGLPVIGARVYFVDTDNHNDQLYEYAIDNTTTTKEGICITSHVPDLVEHENPIILTASQTSSVIALFSSKTPNTIWLYQFYIAGQQKLQSAWSRQVIDGEIKNMAFRNSVLWLEIDHNGQRIMATMDFMTKRSRDKLNYVPSLDYYIEYENPGKTVILPYMSEMPSKMTVLVPNDLGEYIPLPKSKYELEGAVLTLPDDFSKVYVGQTFHRYFEFSEVWSTTSNSNDTQLSLASGRVQLQRWELDFTATGTFLVQVYNKIYNTYSNYVSQQQAKFSSGIYGSPVLRSGKFTVPCRGRNNEISVAIHSDDWLPMTVLSANVYLNYTRHRRTI